VSRADATATSIRVDSVTIAIAPDCAPLIAWVIARRTRAATNTGLELQNEGKALSLYEQMGEIAQGAQNRLKDALEEVEAMKSALAS
jgi:hypothetical protein